jgi:hypothetical protein
MARLGTFLGGSHPNGGGIDEERIWPECRGSENKPIPLPEDRRHY